MKRNPWPYAIIIYFVVFITAMVTWICFAVRNDQDLVRKDYYEQELKFQSELDHAQKARLLDIRVTFDPGRNVVNLQLPTEASSGSADFYRPSNARLDKQITLSLEKGAQSIDVTGFQAGLWRIRLSWKANGEDFRHDEALVL